MLKVRVIPNTKSNCIDSYSGELLKIRVKAPPLDGKANKELVAYLSKILGCKKSEIEITTGHTSQNKSLMFLGITQEHIDKIISDNIAQKQLI